MKPLPKSIQIIRKLRHSIGTFVGTACTVLFTALPIFFLMGRPVARNAPAVRITEPTYLFNPSDCDCWYIHAMAGDIRGAIGMEPYKLPWYAWERMLDGKLDLRFYEASRIRNLSNGLIP